jgi:hypothetical protein
MKGLQILLTALGIKIDPQEVELFYERMKIELPGAIDSLRRTFASIDNRMGLVDSSLDDITKLLRNFEERLRAIEDFLTHDGTPAATTLEKKPNGTQTCGTGRN